MLEYRYMKKRKSREDISLIILGIAIVGLVFGIVAKQGGLFAAATDGESYNTTGAENYITIYNGDQKTILRSSATTVRELLSRAGIEYTDADTIEPGLDEEINSEDFNINIYRARSVVVIDGDTKKYIDTAATEPTAVAEHAGIDLKDEDVVEVVYYNNLLESGMTSAYQVVRAKTVKLNFYGKTMDIRTQANTIGDFLAEQNIAIDPEKNWVSLPNETEIKDGISFKIFHQGKQTITVEKSIAFFEKITQDYSLEYGRREVTKAGQTGKKSVTYEIEMKNGKEISRKKISEIVTKKPVAQQVKVGMKVNLPTGSHNDWMAAAGIAASDYGYVNYIIERESHWNPLAKNPRSGATGVCQALPGSKMASAGKDWATNPITQLRWCNGYAVGRYGSWRAAYEFWTRNHWW